jgi:hypothetical protein
MSDDGKVVKFERRAEPPPPNNFDTRRALTVCREMLDALDSYTLEHYIAAACATQLFIHLHDLAQRANASGKRLTFTDDIDATLGVNDVTDLISKLRNAVCHIRSPSRNVNEGAFVFNRIRGHIPVAIMAQGKPLGCNYPDDTALYYGEYRFYLNRHGRRAVDELSFAFAKEPR